VPRCAPQPWFECICCYDHPWAGWNEVKVCGVTTTEGVIECAGLLVPNALMSVPLAGSDRGDAVVWVSSSICTKEQCRLGSPSEGVANALGWIPSGRKKQHYATSEILNSFLCRHHFTPNKVQFCAEVHWLCRWFQLGMIDQEPQAKSKFRGQLDCFQGLVSGATHYDPIVEVNKDLDAPFP
jgi:hypothetical protein